MLRSIYGCRDASASIDTHRSIRIQNQVFITTFTISSLPLSHLFSNSTEYTTTIETTMFTPSSTCHSWCSLSTVSIVFANSGCPGPPLHARRSPPARSTWPICAGELAAETETEERARQGFKAERAKAWNSAAWCRDTARVLGLFGRRARPCAGRPARFVRARRACGRLVAGDSMALLLWSRELRVSRSLRN